MTTAKLFRLLLLAATVAPLAVCRAQQLVYTDALIAVVGEEIITVSDVAAEAQRDEVALERRLPAGPELKRAKEELRAKVAQRILERELMYAEFKDKGYRVPREVLQKRMDTIVISEAGGNRERFDKKLMDEGSSYSEFEEKMSKAVAVDMLWDEMVRRQVRVSPQTVRAYYDANPARYVRPGRIKLDMIFLSKDGRYSATLDETARKIQEQLEQKTDFAWLARQYSEGPGAASGGDLGWLKESDVQKEYQDAVNKLTAGQVSPPVKTGKGLAFLRLASREKEVVRPFDDSVATEIENDLGAAELEKRRQAYIDSLTVKFHVKIFNELK